MSDTASIGTSEKSSAVPAFLMLFWLVLALPLFIRMPLTNDAILFDLEASLISGGAVLYDDILEPNLPGVIWIHQFVRFVGGPSSEALRVFDVSLFGIVLLGVYHWMRRIGAKSGGAVWSVLACSVFYLSASEWNHCQRDTWMLAVVVCAAHWRLHRLRIDSGDSANPDQSKTGVFRDGVIEGLLWGIGIWIKPYVLLITVAVWLISLKSPGSRNEKLVSAMGLLAGGIVTGLAGIGWMVATDAWPHFLTTLRDWNPHYYKAGRENWTLRRYIAMAMRFSPWILLHLIAVPVAIRSISKWLREDVGTSSLYSASLAAIYLVWLGQSFLLQHLFDYVHCPGVILAVAVSAGWLARRTRLRMLLLPVLGFVLLAYVRCPTVKPDRLELWSTCLTQQSDPELRDRLSLFQNPRRTDLEQVARFLETQNVKDGEVACYNSDLVGLYGRLAVTPPTRYVYLFEILVYFPHARRQILSDLRSSGHRFVVTDMAGSGMNISDARAVGPNGPQAPPPAYASLGEHYPWSNPVVFRAGTYLVHKVELGNLSSP